MQKYILINRTIGIIFIVIIAIFISSERVRRFISTLYFDQKYYLKVYPYLKNDTFGPIDHYVRYGWKEGRVPNRYLEYVIRPIIKTYFNQEYYRNRYSNKAFESLFPGWKNEYAEDLSFHHYFTKGRFNGRHPNRFFEICNSFILKFTSKKVQLLEKPKYYLALVSLFRDEARFLKEWIEFHQMMGVEHFYLYNHLSTDNYMEVLRPYIDSGLVELRHISLEPQNRSEWSLLQTSTYTDVVKETKDNVEWLIVIDTDEFLFPSQGNDLKNTLRLYDSYPTVCVNWKLFGSNNVAKIPKDKLLIETLTKSFPGSDTFVKSIVKPRYVEKFYMNPHVPTLQKGYYQVTENQEYYTETLVPYPSQKILRINHYWARDLEFLSDTKLKRTHTAERKNIFNLADSKTSKEYDDAILRFTSKLKTKVFNIKQ